jgi:anaerobic magnesium-protoporphyrin IX monomethyl ester cyclase
VRILSAYVKRKGIKARLIFIPDFQSRSSKSQSNPEDIYSSAAINRLIDLCSDSSLIGISFHSADFQNAAYLTTCLKAKLNVPVIWGGKHPSAKPEQALSYADMVCIGEGEEALSELLGNMEGGQDYFHTRNIWFKHNGTITKNPLRPLIEDLDVIPFPDYSFKDHFIREGETDQFVPLTAELFGKHMPPESPTGLKRYETLISRGCPFSCSYCFSFRKMYAGQKYLRFRSMENVMQELALIQESLTYFKMVWFLDDNLFMLPAETIRKFSQTYKERIGLPMAFAGNPKDINREKLSYFVEAGLIRIHMGVQTGSQKTKTLYHREIPDETILNAVQSIHHFKDSLFPSYDVIVDNPYESNEDLVDTLRLLLKFPRPHHIKLFSLGFLPGTELYEKAKEDGILSDEEELGICARDLHHIHSRGKKYLNFVFLLLSRNVPKPFIRMLISRYVIFLLDRPLINELLFKVLTVLKEIRDKERKI